jgi:hypothetical protein
LATPEKSCSLTSSACFRHVRPLFLNSPINSFFSVSILMMGHPRNFQSKRTHGYLDILRKTFRMSFPFRLLSVCGGIRDEPNRPTSRHKSFAKGSAAPFELLNDQPFGSLRKLLLVCCISVARSRSKYRGALSQGKASRSCRAVHSAVG